MEALEWKVGMEKAPAQQAMDNGEPIQLSEILITDPSNTLPEGAPRGVYKGYVKYEGKLKQPACSCGNPSFDASFDVEFDTASVVYKPG